MHLTRNQVPKFWPIARKGTKSVVVPSHNKRNGIPIMVILRDILKLAKTRKEVKKILRDGKIKVNGKLVRDEKFALVMFDIMEMNSKNYKLVLENKKFKVEETKDKEKIIKVTNKKILPGGIVQINFNDGRNIITKEKLNVGDSVVMNFDGKIEKKIELKEGSKVIVMTGSHRGEGGKVERIEEKKKTAEILIGKEKVNLELKRLIAI
jgi:small subunit ribosomal protein S4e